MYITGVKCELCSKAMYTEEYQSRTDIERVLTAIGWKFRSKQGKDICEKCRSDKPKSKNYQEPDLLKRAAVDYWEVEPKAKKLYLVFERETDKQVNAGRYSTEEEAKSYIRFLKDVWKEEREFYYKLTDVF